MRKLRSKDWGFAEFLDGKKLVASLVAQTVKGSACNAGDLGSISGLGRSSGEGNGYLCQYSCLENPMDRGAQLATVHGVAKELDTPE